MELYSSWYGINGYTQTRRCLGHEYIGYLMGGHGLGLEEIARMSLDDIRRNVVEFLGKTGYR